MNKKFLSAILFGALVASTGSFVSCADNDAEIKQLQDQNSDLKAQLAALKTELQAELKSAASASQVAAVEAKLSAIESATAENMKATVDALNGKFDTQESKIVAINTQLKALEGLQGVDAKELIAALEKAKENAGADMNVLSAMVDALDEDVNVLKSALRALVFQPEFYMDGIEAAEYTYVKYAKLSSTGDRYIATDVWADWQKVNGEWQWTINGDATTIKNHAGVEVALDKSVEWHYYHKGNIVTPAVGEGTFNQDADNYYVKAMNPTGDYITVPTKNWQGKFNSDATYVYAPSAITTAWATTNTLRFAMNPSNAKVDAAAMSIVTKTIAAMVRGAETKIAIDGCETKGGYLYVKYHFTAESQLISADPWHGAKEADKMNNVNGVILDKQDNTTIVKLNVALDEGSVESDWAAIYETSIQPVALGVVPDSPVLSNADGMLDGCALKSAFKVDEAGNQIYANKWTGAEISTSEYYALPDWDQPNYEPAKYPTGNTEYWKNPYVALSVAPTYGVDYKGSIDLSKLVNVHLLKRDDHHKAKGDAKFEEEDHHTTMTLAEVEEAYGFVAEFYPVDYWTKDGDKTGDNNTHPTEYVKVEKNGVVTAGHVDASTKKYAEGASEASIGKEPLVQVLLKDADGDVVLDAYILLKITRTVEPVTVAAIDLGKKAFDCNELVYSLNWAEFSDLILGDENVKLSKKELDDHYEFGMLQIDGEIWMINQYNPSTKRELGWNDWFTFINRNNDSGANTNHTFNIHVRPAAQEWIYEQPNHEATVMVKLVADGNGINNGKYADIYVPFKIGVGDFATFALGTKVANYWYEDLGDPTIGKIDVLRFNVAKPDYGKSTVPFVSQIANGWVKQGVGVDNTQAPHFFKPGTTAWEKADEMDKINQQFKYYFHAATNNVVVEDEYTGKKIYLWVANNLPVIDITETEKDTKTVRMIKSANDAKNGAIAKGNFLGYNVWKNNGPYGEYNWGLNENYDPNKPGKFINISSNEDPIAYTQDKEANYKLDPDAGMYKNTVLMATVGEYKAGQNDDKQDAVSAVVATLDPATGKIDYAHNAIAKQVLNAITHDEATQKAWVGIAKHTCVVDAVENDVFPVYFLRPLDILGSEPAPGEDDVPVGSMVEVYKKISFMDYRDVPFGFGQPAENIWLAGYYNVNTITVDLANATTTLKDANGKELALKEVETVLLSYIDEKGKNLATADPANTITINMAEFNKESAAAASSIEKLVKHFGKIKYENNGNNVQYFSVTIPVLVGYDWGTMKTQITLNLQGTMANSGNN